MFTWYDSKQKMSQLMMFCGNGDQKLNFVADKSDCNDSRIYDKNYFLIFLCKKSTFTNLTP